MNMQTVGVDVGGAHLKLASLSGADKLEWVFQLPCPLWQGIDRLSSAWQEACMRMTLPADGHYAVTMTGELADCFVSRNDGVSQILIALGELLPQPFYVYAGQSGLVDMHTALSIPERVASANWHAAARCVAEHYQHGVFIDIGSTTTDLVPFANGAVCNRAYQDSDRLACHELLYTGVVRTPVMAMSREVQVANKTMPVVAEYFATAADVYRLSGDLAAYCDQYPSSDGAPATRPASARRLARMFARDYDNDEDFWVTVAQTIAEQHYQSILSAYTQLCRRQDFNAPTPVVAAGVGRFIAKRIAATMGCPYHLYSNLLPSSSAKHQWLSDCATAVSVARLLYQLLSASSHEPVVNH